MPFGYKHYVPVLKIKRGEKKALRLISPSNFQNITPLLEIVERTGPNAKSIDDHLNTAFKDLADSVRPYPRCFIDVHEIESDGSAAAGEVFRRALVEGIIFTPVTCLNQNVAFAAAMSNRKNGLALRIYRNNFEASGLATNIQHFLTQNHLTPQEIDLIVDLGPVDTMISIGIIDLTKAFLAEVPFQDLWKTFTVSACAFPSSMKVVERSSDIFIERSDWTAWFEGLYNNHRGNRIPTYSDCAIQHTEGVEGFDPIKMKASAAVRYAALNSWLLIKGVGTRTSLPSTQFPKLARQLVYGQLNSRFYGVDHCHGCLSIKASADGAPKLGSPEAWRMIGTIHHITTVVNDLAALP